MKLLAQALLFILCMLAMLYFALQITGVVMDKPLAAALRLERELS